MIETSMYNFMFQNYKEKKDAVALSFLYKNISYQKLKDEVDRIACFLQNFGIQKNDCVTIALPNIPSSVSVFYAVNKIGAVANMVHPLVPYKILKQYMTQTKSKIVFCFDTLLDNFFDKLVDDNFKVVVCKANDYLNNIESFFYTAFGKKRYKQIDNKKCILFSNVQKTKVFDIQPDNSFDDARVIMHSSGTTAQSKSAILTNKNFNAVAKNTIQILPWKDKLGVGMASVAVLPMFHAFGLGVTTHTILSYGYTSVLIPKYSAKLIVKKIKQKNVAILAGVPTMFLGMVNQKGFDGKHLKKLKFAFCGGDKLDKKLKDKFDFIVSKNGGTCLLDEGYGLTEAAGVFSVNTRQNNRDGSVGRAISGEICAFNKEGTKLLPGTFGELCVSSDAVMKGYLKENSLVDDCFVYYADKKYVKTGDYGCVDQDGFIYFKQRIKRIEKVSGINVFPAQAEDVILSIKGVKMCCVIGVPDEKKGTVLKAFLVLDKNVCQQDVVEKIKQKTVEQLDKWTQPKIIEVVRELPLNNFGKVDYKKLGGCAYEKANR